MDLRKIFAVVAVLLLFTSLQAQDFSKDVQQYIRVNQDVVVLTNARVIDGTGAPVREDQTILIEEGMIEDIGDDGEIATRQADTVIDCSGKTVIPGLVMLHEHLFYSKIIDGQFHADHMTYTFPKMFLAGGVTTMRTAGTIEGHTDLTVKRFINRGKMAGPTVFVTSPHLDGSPYIPQLPYLKEGQDPARFVDYWADQGVSSVKAYMNLTRDELEGFVDAAHQNGIKVTGHLCAVTYREAANIGIDNIEHGFLQAADFIEGKEKDVCRPGRIRKTLLDLPRESQEMEELMQHLIDQDVAITTTPPVFEPYTNREVVHGGGLKALAPGIQRLVLNHYADGVNRDSASRVLFNKELYWIKKFHDMGGHLVVGTDPTGAGRTLAGYANQHTVEVLREAGFSIKEAIHVATLSGAEHLGIGDRTGSLEAGKEADLVIMEGNLKEDVSNIRRMEIVFKDGVGFDSGKLFRSVEGKVGL